MAVNRDLAIKLFGKTIPLQPSGDTVPVSGGGKSRGGVEKDLQNKEAAIAEHKEKGQDSSGSLEKVEPPTSVSSEISRSDSADKEGLCVNKSKPEEEEDDQSPQEEKKIKKPDKIIPCPRCNSMETKFCYYNNYNVNQPRHFCKNCQRYWTAGGTMRNVPVGAGRRKNKNSASHYRHIFMSSPSLQSIPEGISYPPKPSSTVLSFGSDAPLSDSVASVLNLAEKTNNGCILNGFHQMGEKILSLSCPTDNGDEHSGVSPATSRNTKMSAPSASVNEKVTQACPIPPCVNGPPWPYPWIPSPLCAPSYPIPIYPAAVYWNCTVSSGTWTVPWLSPEPSSSVNGHQGTRPDSPHTLGKHSRDGIVLQTSSTQKRQNDEKDDQERSIWVPKTLRIDDPEEAARSSIWAMFGVKNVKTKELSDRGLLKSCHPEVDIKNHSIEASDVLHANPAALSRSLNFQESI